MQGDFSLERSYHSTKYSSCTSWDAKSTRKLQHLEMSQTQLLQSIHWEKTSLSTDKQWRERLSLSKPSITHDCVSRAGLHIVCSWCSVKYELRKRIAQPCTNGEIRQMLSLWVKKKCVWNHKIYRTFLQNYLYCVYNTMPHELSQMFDCHHDFCPR